MYKALETLGKVDPTPLSGGVDRTLRGLEKGENPLQIGFALLKDAAQRYITGKVLKKLAPQTPSRELGAKKAVPKAKAAAQATERAPSRPANLTPKDAGRNGAFRQAKADAGIPRSQQPAKTRVVPDNQRPGQTVKEFDFEVPKPGGGTKTVTLQEHLKGHGYGPGNPQNRGRHLNGPNNTHYDY